MTSMIIDKRYRGPPNSGNGGYVCGRLARHIPLPKRGGLTTSSPAAVARERRRSRPLRTNTGPERSTPAPSRRSWPLDIV